MIKAIIFDCFGVLSVDLWKEFMALLPEDQKQPARDINHAYDAGFMTNQQFLQQIEKLTGRKPSEIEAVRNSDGIKNEELLTYIAKLKTDYKIGLLSNISSNWIQEVLLTKDEQNLFNSMTLSFEVGMTKPDPHIFELICRELDVKPHEAVMIDDIETYCASAQQVGMQAIVYKDFPQLKIDLEQILSQT